VTLRPEPLQRQPCRSHPSAEVSGVQAAFEFANSIAGDLQFGLQQCNHLACSTHMSAALIAEAIGLGSANNMALKALLNG
jgi:hypothetical protein